MKRYLAISFSFCSLILFGQDSLCIRNLSVNASGHYGFIIPHNPNMKYLIKRHVVAGEVNFTERTNGDRRWEQLYRNPEVGIGLYCAELGNPEQLGQALGLYPFINFPVTHGKNFRLFIRSSDGLGFITKPYDRIDNHKNNINGSVINAFINLRLNSVYFPGKKIRMETGIGLTHLSNGAYATPNKGINIATLNIGMSVLQKNTNVYCSKPDTVKKQAPEKKYFFTIVGNVGPNQNSPPDGKTYAAWSLYTALWRTVSEKSRFCLGTDAFYELSNTFAAVHDSIYDPEKKINTLQLGVRLGYELVVGKVSLPLEMGYYLKSEITSIGPLYHRIGIRYQATKHIIINYSLRTHWATAEHLEFGIGYRF